MTGRTLAGLLLRQATAFSLHLVPDPVAGPPRPPVEGRRLAPWVNWAATPALVAAATDIWLTINGVVPEGALDMVYLVATVAAAAGFGALLAALVRGGAGRVVTQRQLQMAVWGTAHVEDAQHPRVSIGHLRQKLRPPPG
jgi:K+-sensing histidine kinase KdpD